MAFVYRFVNNDSKIIYVGKTGNLKERIQRHQTKKEQKYAEANLIEFIETTTEIDAFILETYYINKYAPQYNMNWQKKDGTELKIHEYRWEIYDKSKCRLIDDLKEKNQRLREEAIRMREEYEKTVTYEERQRYKKSLDNLSRDTRVLNEKIQEKQELIDVLILSIKIAKDYLEEDRARAFDEMLERIEPANIKEVRKIVDKAYTRLDVALWGTDSVYWMRKIKQELEEEKELEKNVEMKMKTKMSQG